MKKLEEARRWVLKGYLDILERAPNGYGRMVHRAAQKVCILRLCLHLDTDLEDEWETEIRDVIRGVYGEDQSCN